MHRGQGSKVSISKVSISKQEPCGIFILTYVTLQVKTFPTMYLVYLYGKVFIFSSHGHKPSQVYTVVSESAFKAQYIEAFFFVYLFLFYGNSDQNDLQRLQYYIICFISQCKHTKNVSWHCALKTQHREKKIDKSKVIIIIFIIIVAAQFPVQFESPSG